jgi:hypothetical protein
MAKHEHRPRAIPVQHETGRASAAAATGEYVAGLAGPDSFWWVIKRRATGEIVEHCKGVHMSEIDARVAVLNRGQPTAAENRSWGILNQEGPRREPKRRYRNDTGLTTTQWVERLYGDTRVNPVLRAYVASKRSLNLVTLKGLLRRVDGARPEFTEEMLESISQQLYTKFDIHRAEESARR